MHIRAYQDTQPSLGSGSFVDPSAVVTGRVTLGQDASIWPCVSVRGDLMPIHIGDRSNIQDCSSLHTTHASNFNPEGHALTIGNDVTVGHNVTLHGCTIEDECLIGMHSLVMDGAIVEHHALLAAGAMVPPNKVITGGYLWVGSPAKKVRPITDQEREFFLYSAKHYVSLQRAHQAALQK